MRKEIASLSTICQPKRKLVSSLFGNFNGSGKRNDMSFRACWCETCAKYKKKKETVSAEIPRKYEEGRGFEKKSQ